MIAGQVPVGKIEGTPLPLNGTKEVVADADASLLVLPPVRFAPLGPMERELS